MIVTVNPPGAPVQVAPFPSDISYELGDTGYSISWNWTSLIPDIYVITNNTVEVASGSWTSGSLITISVDGLPIGTYTFICTVNDTTGNSASDTVIVTVSDSTPPTISAPADIPYELGDTGYSISWTANDLAPNLYVITNNTVEVASGAWTSGVPITISVDGLPIGTYTFVCTVNDTTGNSASDTVIVTVNDTAPPTITSPLDLDIEYGTSGNLISWTATDASPNLYTITNNTILVDSGVWTSGVPITISVDGLPIGLYTFNCTVIDTTGNWVNDTVIVTVNDTIGPSYSEPIESADPIDNGTTLEIWINVTDISGVNQVWFDIDGFNYTMQNITGDTYYNNSWTPIINGTYSYQIAMQDTIGNWRNITRWIDVSLPTPDPIPPTVNITYPTDGDYISTGSTIRIGGFVNGTGSDIQSIKISREDLFDFTNASMKPYNQPWGAYEFSNKTYVPGGLYTITITVFDQNSSHNASATVWFIVDFDIPQIFVDITIVDAEAGIDYSINVTIIDSDPFLTALIVCDIGGVFNITMTRESSTSFTGSIPGANLNWGIYVIFWVLAIDTPGRNSSTIQYLFYVNDTTPPDISAIRFSRLPFIRPGESVILEIEVADEEFGAPISEVSVWFSAGLPWSSFRMSKGSPYRAILPPMPAGTVITYYFNVTDAAGNSIISDRFVTVVLPEDLAFNILFILGTMVGAAVIGAAAMVSSRRHEQETTRKWKRLVATTGTAQTKATLREEALRKRLRERTEKGPSWIHGLFLLIFGMINTFLFLLVPGGLNIVLSLSYLDPMWYATLSGPILIALGIVIFVIYSKNK
ncbi:MAG: hypothetical protein HWN67_04295 [Candidatus Helarchaeota archaeon]|nr:hypothetical protein [Candidatus Helarchaeota archaeon]